MVVVVCFFLLVLFTVSPDGEDIICVDGPSILPLCFLGLLRTPTALAVLSFGAVLVTIEPALSARGDVLLSNLSKPIPLLLLLLLLLLLFVFFAIGVVVAATAIPLLLLLLLFVVVVVAVDIVAVASKLSCPLPHNPNPPES